MIQIQLRLDGKVISQFINVKTIPSLAARAEDFTGESFMGCPVDFEGRRFQIFGVTLLNSPVGSSDFIVDVAAIPTPGSLSMLGVGC